MAMNKDNRIITAFPEVRNQAINFTLEVISLNFFKTLDRNSFNNYRELGVLSLSIIINNIFGSLTSNSFEIFIP